MARIIPQRLTPQDIKEQFLRKQNLSENRPEIVRQQQIRQESQDKENYYKQVAKDYETQIIDNNYFGSISNFISQYNTIDPNIRKYIAITPNNINQIQQQSLNNIKTELNFAETLQNRQTRANLIKAYEVKINLLRQAIETN